MYSLIESDDKNTIHNSQIIGGVTIIILEEDSFETQHNPDMQSIILIYSHFLS